MDWILHKILMVWFMLTFSIFILAFSSLRMVWFILAFRVTRGLVFSGHFLFAHRCLLHNFTLWVLHYCWPFKTQDDWNALFDGLSAMSAYPLSLHVQQIKDQLFHKPMSGAPDAGRRLLRNGGGAAKGGGRAATQHTTIFSMLRRVASGCSEVWLKSELGILRRLCLLLPLAPILQWLWR